MIHNPIEKHYDYDDVVVAVKFFQIVMYMYNDCPQDELTISTRMKMTMIQDDFQSALWMYLIIVTMKVIETMHADYQNVDETTIATFLVILTKNEMMKLNDERLDFQVKMA